MSSTAGAFQGTMMPATPAGSRSITGHFARCHFQRVAGIVASQSCIVADLADGRGDFALRGGKRLPVREGEPTGRVLDDCLESGGPGE